ncbi:MAG: hypothetical protein JSW47_02325 [Phycisphaerales bacterium]|nr:MAG: hypothetical protein JSW47_02325 [Phycisphaerales bacterium]
MSASRQIVIALAILLTFSLVKSPAAEDLVAQRQKQLLDNLQHILVPYLGKDLGPAISYLSPRPWRSALAKHTACLLKGTKSPQATTWFKDKKNLIVGEWEILLLLRSYHALKDVEYFKSSGARGAVEEYLRRSWRQTRTKGTRVNWKLDGYWGSENHKIVQFSNRLLLEEFAAPASDMGIRQRASHQIIMWCREKALRGYTEYASTHYTERTLVPLLNIYDYALDTKHSLRQWSRMAIDQLLAEYELLSINGFRGGAIRRCYQSDIPGYPNAELNNGVFDSMITAGYIFFDNTDLLPITYRASDQSIIYTFAATTSYRPTPVHEALADPARRGAVCLKSARRWDHEGSQPQAPDTYWYTWITPHYILGSIRGPAGIVWQGAVNGGVPYRVSFRDPQAMIGTRVAVGATPRAEVAVAPDPPDQGPLFQHQNVLFYRGTIDMYRDIAPKISVGRGIDYVETDPPYSFFREPGANGETVYVGVFEKNGLGVMEVRLASQHKSWKEFKRDVRDNAASLISPSEIAYETCDGQKIRLRNGRAYVNGVEQQLDDWPLYGCRLIRGDWLNQSSQAGFITIGDEQTGQLVLDFRDPNSPRRELKSPQKHLK